MPQVQTTKTRRKPLRQNALQMIRSDEHHWFRSCCCTKATVTLRDRYYQAVADQYAAEHHMALDTRVALVPLCQMSQGIALRMRPLSCVALPGRHHAAVRPVFLPGPRRSSGACCRLRRSAFAHSTPPSSVGACFAACATLTASKCPLFHPPSRPPPDAQ